MAIDGVEIVLYATQSVRVGASRPEWGIGWLTLSPELRPTPDRPPRLCPKLGVVSLEPLLFETGIGAGVEVMPMWSDALLKA
jgi:hypothetical protein